MQGMDASYLKIVTPEIAGRSGFNSVQRHWPQLNRQCRESCHGHATPAIAGALCLQLEPELLALQGALLQRQQ